VGSVVPAAVLTGHWCD